MRTLLISLFCIIYLAHPVKAEERVNVCDDSSPWPPYTYPESDNSDQRTGSMVDFLEAIMKNAGLEYTVQFKPWKRCLKELRVSKADLMIGAAFNNERAEFAYFTRATHQATPALFYEKDDFPEGPDWKVPQDTENFSVCTVRGFDYSDVILSEQVERVEFNSREMALQQLKRDRCQILFSAVEPVLGTRLYGDSILPDGVTYKTYKLGEPSNYHLMVSKAANQSDALLDQLNNAIADLIANGSRDAIFEKYHRLMHDGS